MEEGMMLDLFGFYMYNGEKNDLDGHIEIMSNGSFSGEIYDHGSRTPEQIIKGHIIERENKVNLFFLKFPSADDLANLVYQLESPITSIQPFSFRRDYKGTWEDLPYKIEYNEDYDILIARIDPTAKGIGGLTEISICA